MGKEEGGGVGTGPLNTSMLVICRDSRRPGNDVLTGERLVLQFAGANSAEEQCDLGPKAGVGLPPTGPGC